VIVILLLLILLGIEVYLRLPETHIVKEERVELLSVELDAEFLVEYTPRGCRLIPNSRVLIKNHRISHSDIKMEINSLGFRDDEISPEKSEDELRILVLGDSITWASYLPAEETFVERVEEYLRQSFPDRLVEGINAGVGDIGLKEEIAILEERGLAARPDLVVISFYLNDSRPPWGFPGELGSRGWLRRHSLLAETIYKKAFQVYADFTEDIPQQLIREKARKRNFPFLDLLPYLRKYRRDHKDIYYDWCHTAVNTNDFIGKIIAEFLLQEARLSTD